MNIKQILTTAWSFTKRHSTKMLSGLALIGLGTSVATAIQDTPKAQLAVDRMRDELPEGQQPTKKDILKAALPAYGRTIASTALTAGCIVGAEYINDKQKALLGAAYAASEVALNKWKAKTKEVLGEERTHDIYEAQAKEEVAENPVTKANVINTGLGDSLIRDSWSGRYFTSDIEKVRRAVNDLNRDIINEMWATVNDWYYYLGIPSIEAGAQMGWNVDHLLEVDFSTEITDDGRPCLVIEYVRTPILYNGYFTR